MFRRIEQNSLQAFYKRFSGLVRALPPEPAGADAWRATTYGHGVLQTNPHGSALGNKWHHGIAHVHESRQKAEHETERWGDHWGPRLLRGYCNKDDGQARQREGDNHEAD